jgi:hypothetical protein
MDANSNFEAVTSAVDSSLTEARQDTDMELYNRWLEEAKSNPIFPRFSKDFPTTALQLSIVVGYGGSGESQLHDYLSGSTRNWNVKRHILSPHTDFSQTPWDRDDLTDVIDLKITCHRPWSIFSRKTSISIEVHQALNNPLLLDRLKGELDKAGLEYNIQED